MNLKPDIRATDPIFEAMRNWMKTHPGVNMQMQYDTAENSIVFIMEHAASGKRNIRHVPFKSYDITTLTPEQLTQDALEAMWTEFAREDKNE